MKAERTWPTKQMRKAKGKKKRISDVEKSWVAIKKQKHKKM